MDRSKAINSLVTLVLIVMVAYLLNYEPDGEDESERRENNVQLAQAALERGRIANLKAINALPPHEIVDIMPIPPKDGSVVQIETRNPELSKDECKQLIDHYRHEAGREGQVAVSKPSKLLEDSMLPWCVDNLDGQGIFFNVDWFPEAKLEQ